LVFIMLLKTLFILSIFLLWAIFKMYQNILNYNDKK
jgi:hypothetical protein